MSLTSQQIINKELDYFKSDLASEPAFITGEYDDEYGYVAEDKCVYKTPDGRKCAVGALIKPAHYEERFDLGDGTPVNMLSDQVLNYLGTENVEWLKKLQYCHDTCARDWGDHNYLGDGHFGRHFLEVAKAQRLL